MIAGQEVHLENVILEMKEIDLDNKTCWSDLKNIQMKMLLKLVASIIQSRQKL